MAHVSKAGRQALWQVNNILKIKLRDEYLNHLLNVIIVWLFSYSVVSAIISLTLLQTNTAHILLYTGLFTAMSFVMFYNEYTMAASGSVLVVLGLYVNWVFTRETISPEWTRFLLNLHGTWLFITGMGPHSYFFNITTVNVLICLITCVTSLLINLRASYTLIFALGAGFFIAANMMAPNGYHPAFFIMLAVLFITFIKISKPNPKATLKLIPICLAAIALAWTLPMPANSLSQRTLEEAYEDIYWFFREPFRPKYFSTGTLGFESADGTLGGDMLANNDFVMYVFAEEPLYLTGTTKDIYTGTSWKSSYEDAEFVPTEGIEQLTYGSIIAKTLIDYGTYTPMQEHGITQKKLTVNIGKARTGTIFQPDFPSGLELYDEYSILRRDTDLRVDPLFKKDAAYTFNYHDVDYDGDSLQQMLASSYRGYYTQSAENFIYQATTNEFLTQFRRSLLWDIAHYYLGVQEPYANLVYENYTSLPETLPGRVFELVSDITRECETDYEKITAIQQYLHGLTYTLSPGPVPKNRDFVDYFLFENEEGYCTYFATSMAVMARAAGLPSRYKEGYLLPENKTDDAYYNVKGTNAHAWAEVYFEGVGWIPIEATPASFFSSRYPSLAENANYEDRGEGDVDEPTLDPTLRSYDYNDGEPENGSYTAATDQIIQTQTEVKPVTIVLVSAFCGAICYMFFRKMMEDKRHKIMIASDSRQAVLESFRGLVDLFNFYGMPMEKHESAIVYADRISKYSPLSPMTMTAAALIFSKARYSINDISSGEAASIRQAYFTMYKHLRSSSSKYRFFIHRYIKKL